MKVDCMPEQTNIARAVFLSRAADQNSTPLFVKAGMPHNTILLKKAYIRCVVLAGDRDVVVRYEVAQLSVLR